MIGIGWHREVPPYPDHRRISLLAECPDQGPLTEPAADARPRGRGLLFLPRSRHSPRAPASNTLTPAKIVERYERSN